MDKHWKLFTNTCDDEYLNYLVLKSKIISQEKPILWHPYILQSWNLNNEEIKMANVGINLSLSLSL